jgi:uncharacterized protein
MFDTLVIDGVEFKIEPDTNFWGTGESSTLGELYSKVRGRLSSEMEDLRFKTDIILLYVNPTDACNASCPYCYLPQRVKKRKKDMTYQEIERITHKAIEFFRSRDTKGSIIFHGSEPLLNKDNLFKIIRDYGEEIHFGIQTNSLLLTEEDADFIKKYGVNIGISLDSPVEEINDRLRGRGQYKKVLDALKWFRHYRGLNVVTTITTHNLNQLSGMVRFLHAQGVSLCLMNPVRGTQEGALALRPDPLKLADEFIKAVEEAIRLTKEGRRIVIADFANILLGIIAPSARVMMCDVSPCGGGRRFFSITADGNAYPCGEFIGMEEFFGGNIFSESIEEITSSKNFHRVVQRAVEEIPECRECLFRNMCGAPCPAEIYSTEGNMFSKSYYCDFYKKIAEHAFKVIYRDDVEYVIRKSSLREIYRL